MDDISFDQLYGQYAISIYKFVYRLTGDDEESKDITQESFIKVSSQLDLNANQKNPKSWIYRVATNLTYNHLNRKSRFRKIITAMGDFSSNNHSPTSEEEYLNKKKKELIRRSLNQLPFRDQVIINLQQSGLTYKEISTVLKIKKTSVGKILSRAIEKLACQVRQEQNKKMKTVKKGGKNGMFKQKKYD